MVVVFSGNCGRSLYHFRFPAVKHIQKLGHKVIAVLPKDEYTEKIISEGVEVIVVEQMVPSGKNLFQDYKLYKEYLQIYSRLHPNIIFEYTIKPHIYSSIAAKKLNIPCIAIVSGLGYSFTHKSLATYFLRKIYKYGIKKTKQVWFSNNADKELFQEHGFVKEKNAVLLNGEGIDTNYYLGSEINSERKSFLFAGRLLFDKGIEIYFEAAKKLKLLYPDVNFNILGFINNDDPRSVQENTLKKWAASGIVNYLGSTRDIKPFIRNSSCIVLPSFYKEGMSTVLMEAASMGRPLIATDIPGCRELIEDNFTGFICTPKSIDDLAKKMEKIILMSHEELNNMGQNSRDKMIREFDFKNIYPIYEQAVAKQ